MLRQVEAPPPLEMPPLSGGVLHRVLAGGSDPLAGTLSTQGLVRRAGREGRFDDLVGRGFQLIVANGDPLAQLSSAHRALIAALDMREASPMWTVGSPLGWRTTTFTRCSYARTSTCSAARPQRTRCRSFSTTFDPSFS
jgi:hypothetical protein